MLYLRTSPSFDAATTLELGPAKLRRFSPDEAEALAARLKSRPVMRTLDEDRDFYTPKAAAFAGATVLEIAAADAGAARALADRAERLLLAACSLWTGRARMHKHLGVARRGAGSQDLFVDERVEKLSAHHRARPGEDRIPVDARFQRAFGRYGFGETAAGVVTGRGYLAQKLDRAFGWLCESRFDPDLESALVKSVIGLESLLVLDPSEPLRQTLSERAAFLLGRDAEERARVARFVGSLYQRRSHIVHHAGKRARVDAATVEAADRLLVLVAQGLAAQAEAVRSSADQQAFFGALKWRATTEAPRLPFPSALVRALARAPSET